MKVAVKPVLISESACPAGNNETSLGSRIPAGRHFASEEYRSGFPGESVRRRPRSRVACRDRDAARVRGTDRALGAGHRGAGRHLPRPVDPCPRCGVRRSGRRGRRRSGLVRSDSAGATIPSPPRSSGVGFSFGYAVDVRGRDAVGIRNATDGWYPAIEVREVPAHPGTGQHRVDGFIGGVGAPQRKLDLVTHRVVGWCGPGRLRPPSGES